MEKTEQINLRLSGEIMKLLKAIGVFEGLKPTELVRTWVTEKVGEYRKDRIFQRELEAGHLKVEEEKEE